MLKYVTVWLDKRDYNLFFTRNGLSVTDEQGPNLVFTFSHRLATREKISVSQIEHFVSQRVRQVIVQKLMLKD